VDTNSCTTVLNKKKKNECFPEVYNEELKNKGAEPEIIE
jgi:hypothetical protein